ncbi:MAG TPA: glucose 1-dehydrogenase [Rhabdaerophilum sp.]|nr:glucose 1-dehydrogenase [Rhabdaerophilum sp.]
MSAGLKGKRALVTGASGGLGEHFARLLAREGACVAIAARRLADCERVSSGLIEAGHQAIAVRLDVADGASVEAGIRDVIAGLGGVDILVNNAGIADTRAWLDTDEARFDAVLDTNLKGAFLVAKACAAWMRGAGCGGAIVNIASILGLGVSGHVGPYATSKAALIQMTKSMALEWARYRIRVNALCPGYIETDINRDFFATEAGAAMIKRIPQRRLGQPSDLDGTLLLLAGEAGAYMTGATIAVDGGHLLAPL